MGDKEVRPASAEYVKECCKVFQKYATGRMSKADFEQALYLLETAANQAQRNALEPTEDELKYAARA